ncbi:MAG: efflux transporter outer membrane subunit [Methylophilaceae bacterium]|nr:efflux transporter outer membrane subunit [Methylophilaceae bacterium]
MFKLKVTRAAVISLLLPMALSSCALIGPNYSRPVITTPAEYANVDNNAESNSANAAIAKDWWTLYQDPILNDLITKALQNNTEIKSAVASIEQADAYAREVGAALFPQVDLDTSGTRSRSSQLTSRSSQPGFQPLSTIYKVQLSTSFEIDFWGKLRRAKESARALALSSRYAKDTVSLSLSSLIATNYLQLRSLEAQIAVSKDNLRSRDESLALTKRRLAGGVVSNLDVQQAQVNSSNLVAQIIELERQREVVLHQLALLTGDLSLNLASSNTSNDLKTLPIPPAPPVGLPSALLENRPDVAQAEQNLVSANANIGVAKAALYPTISLTGLFGGESAELGDILKTPARVWSLGLGLNLPIFDSGRLNSRVDQVTAQQKRLLASYEGAVQTAFTEVNDALVNVRKNTEREAALNASQQAAKEVLRISENRYKAGYTAYLDVLDAQRVYNESATNFIQSRQARLVATVDLFKALGGGWQGMKLDEAKK